MIAPQIAYDAWGNNHAIVIEQLTEDYLDSLGAAASSGQITPSGNEAPILFERKGIYYLMYGPLCCFCHQGKKGQNNLLIDFMKIKKTNFEIRIC